LDDAGNVFDMITGEPNNEIAREYSLMKFGSAREIKKFGRALAATFIQRLQDPEDDLLAQFQKIGENSEFIVLMTPGLRNVALASNLILEEAVSHMNARLALLGLPTIIFYRPPRLESNPHNYAQLTAQERQSRPDTTKTILPDGSFYQNPIHIVFADDVRITGVTADRVEQTSLEQGARSFSSMYALQIDPRLTVAHPEIEDQLNRTVITGQLDENVAYILTQPEFVPVQRFIRLILQPSNRADLQAFIEGVHADNNLVDLYIAALSNDYYGDPQYHESLDILQKTLLDKGLIDTNGLPV
jgi:hypothetical protein